MNNPRFEQGEQVFVRDDERTWRYFTLPKASTTSATQFLREGHSIPEAAVVGAIRPSPYPADATGHLVVIYSSQEELQKRQEEWQNRLRSWKPMSRGHSDSEFLSRYTRFLDELYRVVR